MRDVGKEARPKRTASRVKNGKQKMEKRVKGRSNTRIEYTRMKPITNKDLKE